MSVLQPGAVPSQTHTTVSFGLDLDACINKAVFPSECIPMFSTTQVM